MIRVIGSSYIPKVNSKHNTKHFFGGFFISFLLQAFSAQKKNVFNNKQQKAQQSHPQCTSPQYSAHNHSSTHASHASSNN